MDLTPFNVNVTLNQSLSLTYDYIAKELVNATGTVVASSTNLGALAPLVAVGGTLAAGKFEG